MIAVDYSDSKWLQRLLAVAATENWCTSINCSTCASEQLRLALGLIKKSKRNSVVFLPLSREKAELLIAGLRLCEPIPQHDRKFEEFVRWVIYQVWSAFGDELFEALAGTWSGDMLARMRAHHQRRLEARRLHQSRQGVKMRDWKGLGT